MKTNKLFFMAMLVVLGGITKGYSQSAYNSVKQTYYGPSGIGVDSAGSGTGEGNVFLGTGSGINSTGNFNVGLGYLSYQQFTSGNFNTLLGARCGYGSTNIGNANTYVGERAGHETSGSFNCYFGELTGSGSGSSNSVFGQGSGVGTTGSENSVFGATSYGTGIRNTIIGFNTKTGGSNNTFVGSRITANPNPNNPTGNNNTFIGTGIIFPPATENTIILASGGVSGDGSLTGNNQKVYITSNGNTAIGLGDNTSAMNKLDVRGGVAIGGSLYTGLSTATGATTNGLLVEGNVGVGLTAPSSKLEIKNNAVPNSSGLRFTNLKDSFVPPSTDIASKFLTVDGNGDVVLKNLPSTSTGITNIACLGITDKTNYITKNANNFGDITCSNIYENSWGAVGIGTDNPQNYLEINNWNGCGSGMGVGIRLTNTTRGCIEYYPTLNFTDAYPASLAVDQNGDVITQLDTSIYSSDGDIQPGMTTGNLRRVGLSQVNLHFESNMNSPFGHIYIGERVPSETQFANAYTTGDYKLFVEGGILTEKVKVAVRTIQNWQDHIFANDYKLMPLKEIESFVKENKHLPGIESAEELVKNGLDLGDMQAKQMGKIEELTLYAIEQDKKLEKQGKEIEELKALVKSLIEKNK